jgi:hypothetical protein
MVEKGHPRLSVGAQCRLLSISRSSFYYEPKGETAVNLALSGRPVATSTGGRLDRHASSLSGCQSPTGK